MTPLYGLENLRELWVWNVVFEADHAFLDHRPRLHHLGLNLPDGDAWMEGLSRQTELRMVSLDGDGQRLSPSVFAHASELISLTLDNLRGLPECLDALVSAGPPLQELRLYDTDLTDVSIITRLPTLKRFAISPSEGLDLTPLAAVPGLVVNPD
ncbi:hypothetical protein [Nonomuraea endophytica]|uniref:Leucine-rich repeat domain-containing protein n=1 Tax=Nonomuraea endophytica TaxID=714136 RepID=A0A7W8A294_9ACTN|nr:hypothetical protein [Nonomuraea endophytica]MBB5078226.1 hypothetical protein [Nonomuraea endophytica]